MRRDRDVLNVILLSGAMGCLGGVASQHLPVPAAAAAQRQVVSAQEFRLLSHDGRTLAQWVTSTEGGQALFLLDGQGVARLQVGLYPDGLPFIGLFNEQGQAKALLRLFGGNHAPVLVMKNNNQDRLILGLDLQSSSEPFLMRVDDTGQRRCEFGSC